MAGLQYLILHETTDDGIEKYERELAALGQEDSNLITRARAAMLAGPEPEVTFHAGPMANNAADNALQRLRINECQKPNLLAHDATPEEFRSWAKRFKAFYASSMLQHGPIKEQQAYLNMCLDIMLETSLGSKIDPDMPIFQDDENPDDNYCIQHLEDLFLRKYLLDTRCYNYFNSRQPRGMTMSTFIPTLKKKPKKQKSLVYETTNYTH